MDLEDFVKRIEEEFEEIQAGTLTPDVPFRDLVEWNSVNALLLMALISSEYDVNIAVHEMQESKTLRELYEIVSGKMAQ